jgi:hypothetical protein
MGSKVAAALHMLLHTAAGSCTAAINCHVYQSGCRQGPVKGFDWVDMALTQLCCYWLLSLSMTHAHNRLTCPTCGGTSCHQHAFSPISKATLYPAKLAGCEAVGNSSRLLKLTGLHILPYAKYHSCPCCCASAAPCTASAAAVILATAG